MRIIRNTYCIVILLFAVQANAQDFTLNQLIDSALQNNYLLQANKKNTQIKQVEIERLKTNYQPTISSSASFSYWKFLLPNRQRLLGDALTDFHTDVSVYQTIYDWGKNKVEKSAVENEIAMNDEVQRQIRNTIMMGVTDTYFEILKTQSKKSAYENNLLQLTSQLQFAENLNEIGKVSAVDILKISLQISVVEKDLLRAQKQTEQQKIKLLNLCNLQTDQEIEIADTAHELYQSYKDISIFSDTLYNEVLQNNPTMLISEQNMMIESRQKEILKLQNRPELFLYRIGSWAHGYIPFGDNFNYNVGVGIRYNIPFWGGSSHQYKMLQSDIRIEQMQDEKKHAFLEIKQEIDNELNNLSQIKQEIESNWRILSIADETLVNETVLYQSGQGDIIDVLNAQTVYVDAEIKIKQLEADFLQTLNKLNYLIGNDTYAF